MTIRIFQSKFFTLFPVFYDIVKISLSLGVATDMIIAGSLSFYLHTSRSGMESTNTLINKLMVYTINNGILTSVFDIIVLGFVTDVHNLIFFSIFQVVGNLYTNSMMATLNARHLLSQTGLSAISVPSRAIDFGVQQSVTTVQTEDLQFNEEC